MKKYRLLPQIKDLTLNQAEEICSIEENIVEQTKAIMHSKEKTDDKIIVDKLSMSKRMIAHSQRKENSEIVKCIRCMKGQPWCFQHCNFVDK